MENYVDYVKDFIIDNLPDYEGTKVYSCDLGYKITNSINVNGSITYSKSKAIEYIKEWFDEAAEVYDYQVENYGKCLHNPFENPEAFMICMVIEGVNSILSQCDIIDDNWNEEIELTEEVVGKIIEYVKGVDEISF